MSLLWLIPFCLVSYLFGNISFSILISKHLLKKDVRTGGSGNAGATNMLRTFGLKWGFLVLFIDIAKGVMPALVGFLVLPNLLEIDGFGRVEGAFVCGLSAVVGHCYPVFMKFKGGKGVATSLGALCVASPIVAPVLFFLMFIVGAIVDYASVCSVLFIIFFTVWHAVLQDFSIVSWILNSIIGLIVLFKHRKNIVRLLTGKENRANFLNRIFKKKNKTQNPQV